MIDRLSQKVNVNYSTLDKQYLKKKKKLILCPRCGKFEHIIANYPITQYYIRKRTEENTLKTHRKDVGPTWNTLDLPWDRKYGKLWFTSLVRYKPFASRIHAHFCQKKKILPISAKYRKKKLQNRSYLKNLRIAQKISFMQKISARSILIYPANLATLEDNCIIRESFGRLWRPYAI